MKTRQLRFPPFRLDVDNAWLWRGSEQVHLTPKAFAVLQCLAERPGQLVTKEFLLESVWPGTAVGDAVLKVCVREIRKALGDRVGAPQFVATAHRRGYRFVAEVSSEEESPGRWPAFGGSAVEPAALRYRGPAHLVGRESVLDRFRERLQAAWRGDRQIVFVTGEPGIGKTGVVEAFLERATADPRILVARGQCVETYGTREPYLPVLDALGRLCRESGSWLVSLLRRHAPTWLAQMPWFLDPADRQALAQELLGATRERMLREMAEAVEALTAQAPLILVLEDLHWSDAATIDLVALLARRQEPARLLLIGTYRLVDVMVAPHPLRDVRADLQASGRSLELSLELLAESSVADYLQARFADSGFPPELARVINRRTEGNPLFMVSVVDDLVARGSLVRRGDRWALQAGLDEVEVSLPENLRQMIERRLDHLADDNRGILAAGSVAGMEFSAVSVGAALGRTALEVEERCDELARHQLFIRSLGPREWPDGTVTSRYGFAHALHRNTLYQLITPGRRRAFHQSIAECEEASHGDRSRDIAAELAAHFEQARDDRRAVKYLSDAAQTAAGRYANLEAVGYVERALDLASRLPEGERVDVRLALLRQLGLARRSMGDVRASVDDFAERARYAREYGRAEEEARALLELGGALAWIDRDRSVTVVEQAMALMPSVHDEALRAHARGSHGFQGILLHGWTDEDADACRLAIDAVRGAGELRYLSLHVGRYAYLQSHRAEYRAAAATAEEGLRLALEVGDPYHYMTCQYHRAWALLHLGEWGQALRVLSDGLRMAERNGHHLWARTFRFVTAWLRVHAGDASGARELCERERASGGEVQLGQYLGAIVLGFALLRSGRPAEARRAFEEVSAPAPGQPLLMDWIFRMPLRLGLAECWLAQRDRRRAREHLEELCRLAGTSGERTYLAIGYQTLAEADLAEGEIQAAWSHVSAALGVLDGREVPLAEWRVHATAARVEQARGHPGRARAHWARSAATVERLAASLAGDGDLHRSFLTQPDVAAVRQRGARSLTEGARSPRPRRTAPRRPRA